MGGKPPIPLFCGAAWGFRRHRLPCHNLNGLLLVSDLAFYLGKGSPCLFNSCAKSLQLLFELSNSLFKFSEVLIKS